MTPEQRYLLEQLRDHYRGKAALVYLPEKVVSTGEMAAALDAALRELDALHREVPELILLSRELPGPAKERAWDRLCELLPGLAE